MFDIIIIGAGPGGYETAVHAAKHGLTVLIVESAKPGGTCLNEGCIPTKSFCKSAEVCDTLRDAEKFGLQSVNPTIDMKSVVARKNEVVETLVNGVKFLLNNEKITYIEGTARFVDKNTIEVNGEQHSAQNIIIATGSVTKYLPCEGLHLPGVLTSREILDIDHIPQKMVVIGGGVIGLEFASIFCSLGTEITVVEYAKEILPNFDTDISKRLKSALKARGINIINSAAVTAVTAEGENLAVHYEQKGKSLAVEAPTVLLAVGRTPNVQSLNLADIGIEFSPKGIATDENMLTNVPGIYAIGDVNGKCLLAHAAVAHGKVAVNHILGITPDDDIRLDIMPSAVFTTPEAASVGLTEEQCKAAGIDYATSKSLYGANGKALTMNASTGLCKLIASPSGELLGAHILGAHSSDIIQEITALINRRCTVAQLLATIHPHPTISEVIIDAASKF